MSVTLISLPGKYKCSLLKDFFYPSGITPNSCITGSNNTYIYIYIYIYTRAYIFYLRAHLFICSLISHKVFLGVSIVVFIFMSFLRVQSIL